MLDRETVIKCLEACTSSDDCAGHSCPLWDFDDSVVDHGCRIQMELDALAMLKEQKAVEPIPPKDESDLWKCGNCNHQLFRCTHQRYCEMCGKAVKWE